MKNIGIVAHSAEGASLCFLTACHEGSALLGPHMYPNIVMSAVPMALSLPGWEANDYAAVAKFLIEGVQKVADAENSALPTFDSTRLLAKYAVREAISDRSLPKSGWLAVV